MVVKSWLPEGGELLTCYLNRLMPRREQNTIELAFQSPNPRAQSRGASYSKGDEQMNVIGHEHVSADADAKVGCTPTIFDEALVYFGPGEQTRTSMSVELYEKNAH